MIALRQNRMKGLFCGFEEGLAKPMMFTKPTEEGNLGQLGELRIIEKSSVVFRSCVGRFADKKDGKQTCRRNLSDRPR